MLKKTEGDTMGFSLFPKTYKFYDLFIKQNRIILDAATILTDIFETFSDLRTKCKEVQLLEAEGNYISREIAKRLSLTFITPIDREDIHELNVAQEAIMNVIKTISLRLESYNFKDVKKTAKELILNLKFMLEEIEIIISNLFITKKEIDEHIRRIKTLKEEADSLLLRALGEIYEYDITAPDVIVEITKWTLMYDRIEKAFIRIENLANLLEGISLKYA